MKISDKIAVQYLVAFLKKMQIREVVISPGSRNAPFTLSFTHDSYFNCTSIIDERSAGFIALGKARKLNKPIVVVCTSGSAALNYSPAIVEAYYQNTPLIIITADRPTYGVSIGAGQCFNQNNVFKNYVAHSVNFSETITPTQLKSDLALIPKFLLNHNKGPVHVNVAFEEPLYLMVNKAEECFSLNTSFKNIKKNMEEYACKWHSFSKKLVVLLEGAKVDEKVLSMLQRDSSVYILSENIANTSLPNINSCIDKTIQGVSFENQPILKPDLVITVGKNLISKKLRKLLTPLSTTTFWMFNNPHQQDFFNQQASFITGSFCDFVNSIAINNKEAKSIFASKWKIVAEKKARVFSDEIQKSPFSDVWCVYTILQSIQNSDVFLSNSTAVRYGNFSNSKQGVNYYANRGVSGIDGCTSTAMGFAVHNNRKTFLITGDLGFIYDLHAFWNNLDVNLTIFVLNNGKGDIFNMIDGPSLHPKSIPYFTTPHNLNLQDLVRPYSANYQLVTSKNELREVLNDISNSKQVNVIDLATYDVNNSDELKKIINQINKL